MSLQDKLAQLGQDIKLSTSATSTPQTSELRDVTNLQLSRTQSIFPEAPKEIQQAWDRLINFIDVWYHDIDVEAIRIALASVAGHKNKKEVPVWLFVLGASGTGKSLIPELISPYPETYRLNSITANTLLSGLPKSKGGSSLLLDIGTKNDHSGILIFPDFTTTISRRDDTVKVIAGDLREVYDGHLMKNTGSGKQLKWEGKVTIIAMATPELERLWGPMRGLGERFVQVRWGRSDGISQASKAFTQIGKEQEIKATVRELSKEFISHTSAIFPDPLDPIASGVAHISEITAILRAGAARDDRSKKLEDVNEPEGNTRFFKAIIQIARAHAAMFRREMVIEDYQLASRVAIDSIPPVRLQVVRSIPELSISQPELIEELKKPKTTILRAVEELKHLGVVSVDDSNGHTNYIELTDRFKRLKERAGRLWLA